MQRRYDRQGFLALQPQAFLGMFIEAPTPPTNLKERNVEIVTIRGPLDHHSGGWCDSYEAIVDRVADACRGSASTVVLKIDSVGGQVFGCFDAVREIRARCTTAGKRLVSYIEGAGCSAGYALACAADRIVVSETAAVGSIGILCTRVDITAQDAALGTRYAFVASGARKNDGNVHAALSEQELAVLQTQCNEYAEIFYALVASRRPGVDADAVRGLEAGIFHGTKAVEAKLADEVMGFDALLAQLATGDIMAEEEKKKDEPEAAATAGDIDDARAALERAAEGDGEDAERARRALRALDADEPADEEETPAESKAARAQPASVSASTATDLANTVAALSESVARLEARNEGLERQQFLASRPDLPKELRAVLQSKPLAEVQAIVNAIPKSASANPAATAVVPATRGATQGGVEAGPTAASPHASWLDQQMGLAPIGPAVKHEGQSLVFSAVGRRTPKSPTGGTSAAPAASAAKAGR